MELALSSGFSEMSQDEVEVVDGGMILIETLTKFLAGRLVWTNANVTYKNSYFLIITSGGEVIS